MRDDDPGRDDHDVDHDRRDPDVKLQIAEVPSRRTKALILSAPDGSPCSPLVGITPPRRPCACGAPGARRECFRSARAPRRRVLRRRRCRGLLSRTAHPLVEEIAKRLRIADALDPHRRTRRLVRASDRARVHRTFLPGKHRLDEERECQRDGSAAGTSSFERDGTSPNMTPRASSAVRRGGYTSSGPMPCTASSRSRFRTPPKAAM